MSTFTVEFFDEDRAKEMHTDGGGARWVGKVGQAGEAILYQVDDDTDAPPPATFTSYVYAPGTWRMLTCL